MNNSEIKEAFDHVRKKDDEQDMRLDGLESDTKQIVKVVENNTDTLGKLIPVLEHYQKRKGFWDTLNDWRGYVVLLLSFWLFLHYVYGEPSLDTLKHIQETLK